MAIKVTTKSTEEPQNTTQKRAAKTRRDEDSLWKDIVERFFYSMLERAIPTLYTDADTDTQPRFLDKELKKATYAMGGGKHVADFLVEVPLKNGTCEWILLHIELQGKGGESLPFRMFHYKALIFAMYKRESAALAILTDTRPKEEPEFYENELYETSVTYKYKRLVVSELDENELLTSGNPFDLALCAAQRALKSKQDERQKHIYLKELLAFLGDRGWNHEDKHRLLLFIEKIINLHDTELILDIVKYQEELEKEGRIMYVSLAERVYRDRGLQEGRQEGMQEGMQKGIEQGERLGKLETARKMKAMNLPIDIIAKATDLSEAEINLLD